MIASVLGAALGAALGGAAGFAWYRLVGCRSGLCPIWTNPWASTAYGAVLGVLIAGS